MVQTRNQSGQLKPQKNEGKEPRLDKGTAVADNVSNSQGAKCEGSYKTETKITESQKNWQDHDSSSSDFEEVTKKASTNRRGKAETDDDSSSSENFKDTGKRSSRKKRLKSQQTSKVTKKRNENSNSLRANQPKQSKIKTNVTVNQKTGAKPKRKGNFNSGDIAPSTSQHSEKIAKVTNGKTLSTKVPAQAIKENDSSSESDWEEVPQLMELDEYNPVIPEKGVEITVVEPVVQLKHSRKRAHQFANYARLHLNRFKKDIQINLHKVHLLCWLAHGVFLNSVLNDELLCALALSLLPKNLECKPDRINVTFLRKFINWFGTTWKLAREDNSRSILDRMMESLQSKNYTSETDMPFIFIVLARTAKMDVRLCYGAFPITFKATNLLKKKNGENGKVTQGVKKICKTKKPLDVEAGPSDAKKSPEPTTKRNNSRLRSKNSYAESEDEKVGSAEADVVEISDDDDFVPPLKIKKPKSGSKKVVKIVSSESEDDIIERKTGFYWVEVYLEKEKRWYCIDVVDNVIDRPYEIEKKMKSSAYVLGVDNQSKIKDLTRRYASQWLTQIRKQRPDEEWWQDTIQLFMPQDDERNILEDKLIHAMLLEKPLPTTVGEFKSHPLYILKRHLLKYEAIYPADSPSLGFLRGEPVFARDCVHTLHTAETWLREAKIVRDNEKPYKMVKSRPKWDKVNRQIFTPEAPVAVFGIWQVEDFVPPSAKDGKVPRNGYGNVELFKDTMLPKGTVHLRLAGLNRVARKLGIDCASAVVGFDIGLPTFDGFVVCEEYKDTLIAAWEEEQVNIRKREIEKYEKRVLGNWVKLVKGLLIHERVKKKYGND